MAVFVALAAALGFLLAYVPNVELLTFTVFASGVVLGRWRGAVVGALAMAIYSGASPYGTGLGMPPLFAAQIVASSLAGMAGGTAAAMWATRSGEDLPERAGRFSNRSRRARLSDVASVGAAGGIGFGLTLVYQALVIVGISSASPEFRTGFLAVLMSNAFFSLIHLVSNTVLFAVLAPTVLPAVRRLAARGFADRPRTQAQERS